MGEMLWYVQPSSDQYATQQKTSQLCLYTSYVYLCSLCGHSCAVPGAESSLSAAGVRSGARSDGSLIRPITYADHMH